MPLLDMQPSDLSCVLTTMEFIQSEAHHLSHIPKLTFDLSLYVKAAKLKQQDDSLSDVVLFLGQFHQRKSFIGAIANIMTGSGKCYIITALYNMNGKNVHAKN